MHLLAPNLRLLASSSRSGQQLQLRETVSPLRRSFRAAGAAGLFLASVAAVFGQFRTQAVVTGLDNPRGLAFGPDGALYITETGRPETPAPGTPSVIVNRNPAYYGTTGAITRWDGASQTRILSGLPTLYTTEGIDIMGAHGIGFDATGDMYFTTGLASDPTTRSGPELNRFGLLMRVPNGGSTPEVVADVAGYEAANNPAGGPLDSNPFKIAVHSGGVVVADAGGNSVVNVTPGGGIELLTTVPTHASGAEPVPTSVAMTSGGGLYLSQLTGFPFPVGGAGVFRLDDDDLTLIGSGFTNVIDLAAGPDGMLYVLELAHNGLLSGDLTGGLWQLDPLTGLSNLLMTEGLLAPTALAFDADGTLYVANRGLMPGQGEVLRFQPVPEPAVTGAVAAAVLAGLVLWRRRSVLRALPSSPRAY